MVFSPDRKLAASGGQALRLWNVQTGEEVESFNIRVYSLAFSPDGTCIAAGCQGKNYPQEMSRSDGRGSYNIRVINLESANASYFHAHMSIPSGGKVMELLKGEVPPSPFEGHKFNVVSVAYSPDGKQIASSSDDRIVRVWDVSTGESRTFNAPPGTKWTSPVTFFADGTKLVLGTSLINLSTGSFTLNAFHPIASSMAFSADGRFLASGSFNMDFRIRDASTRQTIAQLIGHTGDVSSVDFFPDGKQIMSASIRKT